MSLYLVRKEVKTNTIYFDGMFLKNIDLNGWRLTEVSDGWSGISLFFRDSISCGIPTGRGEGSGWGAEFPATREGLGTTAWGSPSCSCELVTCRDKFYLLQFGGLCCWIVHMAHHFRSFSLLPLQDESQQTDVLLGNGASKVARCSEMPLLSTQNVFLHYTTCRLPSYMFGNIPVDLMS